jgi:hypothetical protein
MGTLDMPFLMGQVGSRRLDCVPGLSKQVKYLLAATQFSSKVHPNAFGIDRGSGTLGGKPFVEPLDGRSLEAKSSTVRRFTEKVMQEYVTCFAMQAAEATNALPVLEGLHDRAEVEINTLFALSCRAGRRGRLISFVEVGVEANRAVIDLGGDRQVGYANSVLVHATNTARMHVTETLMPNNAEGLTSQVADLPSDIFIIFV